LAFVTFVNKHLRPGKYSAVKVATDIFCNDLFINLLAAAKKQMWSSSSSSEFGI